MSSIAGLLTLFSARRTRGIVLLSIALGLALAACGGGSNTSINQTPTGAPTTEKPSPTPTPKPGTAFRYAFARGAQIWVAQPGKQPQQISQLPDANIHVTALAWSPDGKHLAFERAGAGNPVDYVLDVSTGTFSVLNVPTTSASATFGWSNNKTVIVTKRISSDKTQVWRVDITNGESKQMTEFSGTSQVLVRGQSFYYTQPDTNTHQLMLHRYDINLGSEGSPVAITPAGESSLNVNWDVSADGSHVVMGFKLAKPDALWDNGFWYISFSDNTDREQIFTELSLDSLNASDPITLSFSPDGQTVVLDTQNGPGPASEGVDGSDFHQYAPHVGITSQEGMSWAPNGASFALSSTSNPGQVTMYMLGSATNGVTLIDNASLVQWAPQQS